MTDKSNDLLVKTTTGCLIFLNQRGEEIFVKPPLYLQRPAQIGGSVQNVRPLLEQHLIWTPANTIGDSQGTTFLVQPPDPYLSDKILVISFPLHMALHTSILSPTLTPAPALPQPSLSASKNEPLWLLNPPKSTASPVSMRRRKCVFTLRQITVFFLFFFLEFKSSKSKLLHSEIISFLSCTTTLPPLLPSFLPFYSPFTLLSSFSVTCHFLDAHTEQTQSLSDYIYRRVVEGITAPV